MVKENNYLKLINSSQKFFSLLDLSLLWNNNVISVTKLASYYVKQGKLFKLKRGIYSLITEKNINESDLCVIGQKLISPSYITYHTALTKHGINFQYYKSVHLFSKFSKTIVLDINKNKISFVYHKINKDVLYLKKGLIEILTPNGSYYLASSERSIIDSWYLNSNLGLDYTKNSKINRKILKELAIDYNSPRIWKNLKLYFNITK
jgi:predicted transcriptional regulator of viral defense system